MSATQEAGDIFGAGRGPAHAMLRSPTVLIASVGLWGMNVFFYQLFRIDYVKVLKHDLLKLEELEQQQKEPPEEPEGGAPPLEHAAVEPGGADEEEAPTGTSLAPPLSPSRTASNTPTKTLIQRQSNAAGVAAVAAAVVPVTATSSPGSGGDEEDLGDDAHAALNANMSDAEDLPELLLLPPGDPTDPEASITGKRLVGLSLLLLMLLHTTYYWWLDVLQGGTIGAVFMFYTLVFLAITLPFRCTRWLRRATVIVLQRTYELINPRCHCITNDGVTPPRFIPFVDVFYADAMCSLSKVFFDWGMLFHMASHYPYPVPASAHNILIPSACAAVPYLIRARQCLIMYTVGRLKQEKNRFSHLWNALKYSSSIFPLCLSAYQQTIPKRAAKDLDNLLIVLMVINSTYSLYWDVVMDWGMWQDNPLGVAFCETGTAHKKGLWLPSNPHKGGAPPACVHTVMRPRLRFGLAMSALILGIDCVLRFSWTLRFANQALFPNPDAFVLCTQFLEVFRRALWNLLRVEWENIKHSRHKTTTPRHHGGSGNGSTSKHHAAKHHHAAQKRGMATTEEEWVSILPTAGKLNTL